MDENIQKLQQMIDESHHIVFFGGAGVSTESGIPDFRSVDGLYNQKFDYPPETILSHSFFVSHTAEFYDFYRQKMICLTARPTASWRSWKPPESSRPLSRRILMVCTRWPAAKKCWNCTAAFTAITAKSAISAIQRRRSSPRLAFPAVPAAVLSSLMLFSMKNSLIAKPLMKA